MSSTWSGGASSVDMSQFYQVFFEETEEHLADMENLLLSIDPATASAEELNAIFRAAHSIKGGSGTFGFTDMTTVTHELESLLDRVRKQEIVLTAEMVDALLNAGDVLKQQLEHHRGQGSEAPDTTEICVRIRELVEAAEPRRSETAVPADAWRISVPLVGEPPAESTLEALASMLGELGTLLTPFEQEGGMLTLSYRTHATQKQVRNLFALLCDPDAVIIDPMPSEPEAQDPDFGFFDAEPAPVVATAEEAYGLFDEVAAEGTDAVAATADPGFGFFDETPEAPAVPTVTDSAATTEDPGFGFFDEAPQVSSSVPEAPVPPVERSGGRRATDGPAAERPVRAGRREGDAVVQPQGDSASIRVSVDKVDQLINQVGELVITQAMLAQAMADLDPLRYEAVMGGMADLERNTRDLQESVMSIRMMPIAFVFQRFPRMVRDVASKTGKQVRLHTEGEATELDKGLIEKIADPLTHLVRNAVDHGIESPEERVAAGKPEHGSVTLRAAHQGGSIVIEVIDDGKGLDRERILAKARERGLPLQDNMSDSEVWQLIFEPGFSTADAITDISGRGVGMDVVRRNIAELGGSIDIESAAGYGTRMMVRLPLTLAIIDGMAIGVGEDVYIIPIATVVETLQASSQAVRSVAGGGYVVEVRGEYLPVVSLHDIFPGGVRKADTREGIMLVAESEGVKNAFLVDELLGQQQVVVKSLEANYRKVPGVSGATIMGDGRVALILDVPTLVRMSRH